MAQFLASIQGSRGEATRLGSKESGMVARVNGWNVGARVELYHEDGRDVVRVYRTSGSNNHRSAELIAEFKDEV